MDFELVLRPYVINLDRRSDRWEIVSRHLGQEGFVPVRVPAVDGQGIPQDTVDEYRQRHGSQELTARGRLGCTRSMRALMEYGLLVGKQSLFVCEDDVVILPGFRGRWEDIEIPEDWQLILLGSRPIRKKKLVTQEVYHCVKNYAAHAYVVRPQAMRSLVDIWSRELEGVNDSLWWEEHAKPTTYLIFPPLAVQRPGYSDLAGRIVHYDGLWRMEDGC